METLNSIRSLLAKGHTDKALSNLSAWAQTQSPIWQQSALLLQASWTNNEQQFNLGVIAYEEVERVRNRIANGALGLLAEIENGSTAPKVVLEGLRQQFLTEPVASIIQGGNVSNFSGNAISVQGSSEVLIGSGNIINKKTGLGWRQFFSLTIGLLIILIGGYFAFDLLRDQQTLTYASLQEISAELKLQGERNESVRINILEKRSELDRLIFAGLKALRQKDYPSSVNDFEQVIKIAPLSSVHQNLAYAYQKMGQKEKVEENLTAAKLLKQPGSNKINLTGQWESPEWEWGSMVIVQNGTQIEGNYTHDKGQLQGNIQNGQVFYKWWEQVDKGQSYEFAEKRQRGDGYFIISPDGKRLSGKWRYEGETDWNGEMTSVKK